MKRVYPRRIRDVYVLSALLDQYLEALRNSPMQVSLKTLSWDAALPEHVLEGLLKIHKAPASPAPVSAAEFQDIFAHIMFRYPTVKIWQQGDGTYFFEL